MDNRLDSNSTTLYYVGLVHFWSVPSFLKYANFIIKDFAPKRALSQ